jgi:hypothetical protein
VSIRGAVATLGIIGVIIVVEYPVAGYVGTRVALGGDVAAVLLLLPEFQPLLLLALEVSSLRPFL